MDNFVGNIAISFVERLNNITWSNYDENGFLRSQGDAQFLKNADVQTWAKVLGHFSQSFNLPYYVMPKYTILRDIWQ